MTTTMMSDICNDLSRTFLLPLEAERDHCCVLKLFYDIYVHMSMCCVTIVLFVSVIANKEATSSKTLVW